MAETKSFFKELKDATLDYKSFFKTFGKDALFICISLILLLAYTLFMLNSSPEKPWWADNNKIMEASTLEIQMVNNELQIFLIKYILFTILISAILIVLFTLFREWVWKDLSKEKFRLNSFFRFLGLNIVILLIISIIFLILAVLGGVSVKFLAESGVAYPIILFVVLIFLVPIVFLIFHVLNYSGYSFMKTRKFGDAFIDTFKSFSKIKKLFAPYIIIIIAFIIFGTIVNIFITTKNTLLGIISYLIIFAFLSWEKVYSSHFFKRIYG